MYVKLGGVIFWIILSANALCVDVVIVILLLITNLPAKIAQIFVSAKVETEKCIKYLED